MTRYNVRVIDQIVHRWDDDGQGEYVCSKGGFEIGSYPTLGHAKKAIEDYFGYEFDPDDYDDEYIMATLIENGDGYADENGEYIVDYSMCIEKVEVVNLSTIWEQELATTANS